MPGNDMSKLLQMMMGAQPLYTQMFLWGGILSPTTVAVTVKPATEFSPAKELSLTFSGRVRGSILFDDLGQLRQAAQWFVNVAAHDQLEAAVALATKGEEEVQAKLQSLFGGVKEEKGDGESTT